MKTVQKFRMIDEANCNTTETGTRSEPWTTRGLTGGEKGRIKSVWKKLAQESQLFSPTKENAKANLAVLVDGLAETDNHWQRWKVEG